MADENGKGVSAEADGTVERVVGDDDPSQDNIDRDFIPEAPTRRWKCNVCGRELESNGHTQVCTGEGTILEHEPLLDGQGNEITDEAVLALIPSRKLIRHEPEHSASQMEVVA